MLATEGTVFLLWVVALATLATYTYLVCSIAIRKGKSPVLWGLISIIPVLNTAVMWLVSLQDRVTTVRLQDIERRLAQMQAEVTPAKAKPVE
jgi:uncharacterized membrane protein